jgi:class 3 adenylate cyclase/putative methionine-R-sulfoxide reductase with GAF domain
MARRFTLPLCAACRRERLRGLSVRPEPGVALARILRGDRFVDIADVTVDAAYRAAYRDEPGGNAFLALGGARSLLAVPLRKDDESLLGALLVYRQEVRPFTDRQLTLLQNFAAQAVIAMENARLLGELRGRTHDLQESLEYQTATSDVLRVISSSAGEIDTVLNNLVETAARICQADKGIIFRLRDGHYHLSASIGFSDEFKDHHARYPTRIARGTVTGRVALERRAVHIVDAAADPEYVATASRELGGTRSMLGVPMLRDDVVTGVITLARSRVEPFTEKQIALVCTFADQAVIAMENARLINETREALEQQTATAEVLGVINSSPGDLAPVFDALLQRALSLCQAAIGALGVFDGQRFHWLASRDAARPYAESIGSSVLPLPGLPLGRIANGEQIVHIPDVVEIDELLSKSPGWRGFADSVHPRTALWVALRKESVLMGVVVIWRQEVRPFTDKQIALLQNFAAQAVIAMENARLLGELRQRTEEVAELNRGLEARVAEQVEELGRVGRLKRFLAPQLAELIVSQGDEKILESHRREIVVVFCDLRGYTAFTETAEPEEVLDFLREYHGALGPLVSQFEGTLDQFSGDGIMVFFNDPVPIADPAEGAVRMAVAMREAASTLIAAWRRRDRELGFGVGIAQGYATLGQIGFAERSGYTAIGTVCNLASRLCAEAKDGQILISGRVAAAVERAIPLEDLGSLVLKGLSQPVSAFNVPLAASQPALRVIEGGPQSV